MSVKTSDRIVYPSRATFGDALDALDAAVGKIVADRASQFLIALDYYATRKGIDFAVICSHSANECNLWQDSRFIQNKDGFGIAVYGDGSPGASFVTYDDAAFYAVIEYCQKLGLPITQEEADRAFAINKVKFVRVGKLVNRADFPRVTTVSQMNTKFGDNDCWWMCDPNGPEAIVQKSRILFPTVPDQNGGTNVALNVDIDLVTNRGFAALTTANTIITDHNTGSGSNRHQEREFVKNGGGDQGVAYHFAVDETGITQILKLYQRGIHAGNVAGNQTSIAIEMCMNREPWATIKENTAQLLAMLHTRDKRLDWGGAEAFQFSLDRVVEHRDWPGANPDCPHRLIQTDGGVEKLVARARQIVAGTTPNPVPAVEPHPIGGEATKKGKTFKDDSGHEWVWFLKRFEAKRDIQTYEYANLAGRKGPKIKKGSGFYCYYLVAAPGPDDKPDMWGTTRRGWRFRLADVL